MFNPKIDASKWKKYKKSGTYRRLLLKNRLKLEFLKKGTDSLEPIVNTIKQSSVKNGLSSNNQNETAISTCSQHDNDKRNCGNLEEENHQEYFENFSDESDNEIEKEIENIENDSYFQDALRTWASTYNIRHTAINALLKILKERTSFCVPLDARTLLETPKNVTLTTVGQGNYWHQGLEVCLKYGLQDIDRPLHISLNFNIDGLPVYKSSREEFWPILFNVFEIPTIKPMVVGIWSGVGKPQSAEYFLRPFVDELNHLLKAGVQINGYQVTIKIRCFVCDSPARAFLKGVINFNGRHGCVKCVVVGEWSHSNKTMSFPHIGLANRTDQDFRNRTCSSHHKATSPLEDLPIDMINDIIVSEELHLIHLGYMKRCLFGWKDGTFKNYKGKWSALEISLISTYLRSCKMPKELHRTVRGLDYLSNWKGLEFRTFFHYISIAVLQDHLEYELYEHFLLIFCAITICSSNVYSHLLNTADDMINTFIECYISIYGVGSITSNIHNLSHVVEEVNRFGILSTMNAYPFENKLYHIKRLLRHGKYPLAQTAKRLSEISNLPLITKELKKYPFLSGNNKGDVRVDPKAGEIDKFFYNVEIADGLFLSNEEHNKWFLTKNNEIVGMENAIKRPSELLIYGTALEKLQDVFDEPIRSSYINIFKSNLTKKKEATFYSINDIKCKLVTIAYHQNQIFIPLIHTLDLCSKMN